MLGGLDIALDGRPIVVAARRQRALLALLLIEAGNVVPVDRLIDQLWSEQPPAAASGTLQAYISHLRRILEPDRPARAPATVLVTKDPGYMLRIEPDQVDSLRFDRLRRSGHAALAAGDAQLAEDLLGRAMAEWRGSPLPDFADEPWAGAAIAQLNESHQGALEDRMDAWLALGWHARAVAELEAMVEAAPLRERRWALLLLALYRSGRQAEALRAFNRCRVILGEELGLEPGAELRQLEEAILRQDPSLDARPTPPGVESPRQAPAPEPEPEPLDESGTDVPRLHDMPLVAREAHLRRIRERIAGLGERGGALLLVGEPGVGKTALATAAAELAEKQQLCVVWGRCPDDSSTPAHWLWTQLLRSIDGFRPDPAVSQALALLSGEMEIPADARSAHFLLYDNLQAALVAASRRGPMVLVIDDLHAADHSSLTLMRLLGGDLHRLPILVMATVRDTEPSLELDELLGDLSPRPGVERIAVQGLAPADVRTYVRIASGTDPAPEMVAALYDRTGGNPFYLRELLRLLGSMHREGPVTVANVENLEVPAGIRDVLIRRVARLPEETHSVLTAAAVAGRDVDLDLLSAIVALDTERVLIALEPAVASGFLVEQQDGWGYRFAHALVRDSMYTALSRVQRARLHARVAEATEGLAGPDATSRLSELAHHYLAAGRLGDPAKAIRYARQAAAFAVRQTALDEAADRLEAALGLLDAGDGERAATRCDVLIELANVRRMAGNVTGAQVAVDEAVRLAAGLGDEARLTAGAVLFGAATLWNWRGYLQIDDAIVTILEEQLDRLGHAEEARRVQVLGALAVELYYSDRQADRERHATAAVEIARRVGDPTLLGRALNNFYIANWVPERETERRAATDEALSLAGRGLPADTEVIARIHRMWSLLRNGEIDRYDAELARCREIVDQLRLPEIDTQLSYAEAGRHLLSGRWEEAERKSAATAAREQRMAGVWGGEWSRVVQQVTIARGTGTVADLVDHVVARAAEPELQLLRPSAVLCLTELGREREARSYLERWWAEPRREWSWGFVMAQWAIVAAALGAPDPAWLYEQLAPWQDQLAVAGTGITCFGSTHGLLAGLARQLERPAEADRHAELAVEQETRLGIYRWS